MSVLKFFSLMLTLSVLTLFLGCTKPDDNTNPPIDPNAFRTNPNLDIEWANVSKNADGIESRQIFEFLLEATASNWDQSKLKIAFDNVTALQLRDPLDPYYGNYLFNKGPRPSSIDENAVEFCMEQGSLLRMLYYNKLNDGNKKLLDELVRLSLIGIRRHIIAVTYTNAYVMKTWNLIALGETLNDQQVAQEGYNMLKNWMQNMSQVGVCEYNSPTYTGVAATDLGCIANQSKNALVKSEANIALEYFSLLLFGNYFKQAMYLGGAHSRDYNYVSGQGNIDEMMKDLVKGYDLSFFNQHAVWKPTDQAKALIDKFPRTLIYKFGSNENQNVVSYTGVKYNISSAGATFGPDDKNLVINLSSTRVPLLVNVSSVIEGRSDPYGLNDVITSQGHSKPRHLSDYLLARAQRGSELVVLIAVDGKDRTDTEKLCSHVIFPSNKIDGLWNGNTELKDWATWNPAEATLSAEKTFFIRFEDVVVGIKYLYVRDVNGLEVPVKVINQKKSFTQGQAMHLSAQLSTSHPSTSGVVAMWWRVEEGINGDAAFAAFRNEMINAPSSVSVNGDEYTVKVTSPKGELGVSGNKTTKKQTANFGGITIPAGSTYSVDGIDVSKDIFRKSTYQLVN